MRSNNSTLWLFPTCQVYSPRSSSPVQSARLAWRVEVSRASSSIGVFLELVQQFTVLRTCRSKQHSAFGFTHHFQVNSKVLIWPELIGFIRPLNNTDARTKEIVFETKINYLFGVFQPIQVKMI